MGEQVEGEVETVAQPVEPEDAAPAGASEPILEEDSAPGELVEEDSAPEELVEEDAENILDRLDARLAESQRLLARQTDLTQKLHAENQVLRAGELRSAQMPLVRDLIRLSDDLERMRAVAAESADDLTVLHESLLDVLARNGVEAFESEWGEAFDSRVHSVAGVETTEDEQLDKTVAEVVRRGFRWSSGEVIRVVEVRAYRASGGSG
jgi:molecular chaperone GrpE (heat shock protein)